MCSLIFPILCRTWSVVQAKTGTLRIRANKTTKRKITSMPKMRR